jgi:hypothetical protein
MKCSNELISRRKEKDSAPLIYSIAFSSFFTLLTDLLYMIIFKKNNGLSFFFFVINYFELHQTKKIFA